MKLILFLGSLLAISMGLMVNSATITAPFCTSRIGFGQFMIDCVRIGDDLGMMVDQIFKVGIGRTRLVYLLNEGTAISMDNYILSNAIDF